MPAININHINIQAPMELLLVLREFYCDVLGLHVGPRPAFTRQGYWLYATDQAIIHLTVSASEKLRAINALTTLDHVAFTCSDLAYMSSKLKQMQIPFKLNSVPDSVIQQLFFYDPAGNGVELTFPSGI